MRLKIAFSCTIQAEVKVTSKEDLRALELSETRILLLYSTRQEGSDIMRWAKEAGLTGNSFVWIATQSVIGESKEALPELPAGMLGKCYKLQRTDLFSPQNFPNWLYCLHSPRMERSISRTWKEGGGTDGCCRAIKLPK